ncbi:MAG: hypothetical protein O3C40_30545 [Planctomycetota bacterium]|nr:hypothetical protein [Planctomycetota bacterium]
MTNNCDWAIGPNGSGIVVSTSDSSPADYLVGITSSAGLTLIELSVGFDGAYISQNGNSGLSVAAPLVLERNGEVAFALAVMPNAGGNSSTSSWASRSWLDGYADWFSGTFGSGWSETAGGVIHSVITTVVSDGTLANTSDGALLTGTVIVSVPIAIGIVYGGEVALGVGTFGGGATLVGSTAVVAPGLGAGTYPALVVNGTVYVARFHNIAWQLAGATGTETFYGFATITASGQVINLIK